MSRSKDKWAAESDACLGTELPQYQQAGENFEKTENPERTQKIHKLNAE
jgi:hypothetical protein